MDQPQNQKNQNQRWKKILLKAAKITGWFVASVLIFLLTVTLIIYFSRDKIKQYVISEINKKLLTEIYVGDVDITIFSTFPYVSVVFKDVAIPEVINGKQGQDTLITAANIYLQFNFWDILRKNYILRRLSIERGSCSMKILKDGSNNYMFWKTDTISEKDEAFRLLLNRVKLTDVSYEYENYKNNIDIAVFADNCIITGAFYEQNFDVSFKGNLQSHYLKTGKNELLKKIPLVVSGVIQADNFKKLYLFSDVMLKIQDVVLHFEGSYQDADIPVIAFKASNEKCKLSDFESLLPENIQQKLEPFSKKGHVMLRVNIAGPLGSKQNPSFTLFMNLEDGRFQREGTGAELKNLRFIAEYNCPDLLYPEKAELVCSEISGELGKGALKGNFSIKGFKASEVQVSLEANLDIQDIQEMFQMNEIEKISGNIRCDLQFSGTFKDINQITVADFLDAASQGNIYSEQIEFQLKNFREVISLSNLKGTFSQKDLMIENVIVRTCASDITITGKASNIFPFLLMENQQLFITGTGTSDLIYVDRLLSANSQSDGKSNKNSKRIDFSDNIKLDLNVRVKELYYDTFSAYDIRSRLILGNKVMLLRDMTFKTMEGTTEAEVIIDARPTNNIEFRVMARLNDVNITQGFKDLNNFGQTSMTDKNLKGFLSGTVHFSSVWTKELDIDLNSVMVVSDITIRDGAIKNYEPLAGLRKYLRRRDFSYVEFATLSNQIIIRDKEILIPQMKIQSSVMDFEMQGTHYFDNRINYNFEIKFSELLRKEPSRQKSRAEDEYGTIAESNDNQLTWHFKVTGTVDNPKFVPLDIKAVTEKTKQDFRDEGKKAVNILQKEFGNKKDSTEKIIEHQHEREKKLMITWEDD